MNRKTTRRIILRSRRFSGECLVVSPSRPHRDPLPAGEGTAFAHRYLDRESRRGNPQTSISTGA
jgi:hypothetical protein